MRALFSTFILGLFMVSCSTKPLYTKTVPNIELKKFMGPWHVQAGRFTMFEKDPYNSVESYSWNAEKNQIDIDFRYNQGGFDGPLKTVPQKGWVLDSMNNSHWVISPLWPLKFDYLIIGLGENYEYTVIGVPDQKWLWVMTRDPHFPREKVDQILKEIEISGYSIKDIQYVQHKK